jgi:RNA polymerase sigma-70 factor (ECF subfamily)
VLDLRAIASTTRTKDEHEHEDELASSAEVLRAQNVSLPPPHGAELRRTCSPLYKLSAIGVYQVVCVSDPQCHWCQGLYETQAAPLILYGRALGLSHCEAEDVLHETFLALMQQVVAPDQPSHYCLRSFRNRALNYRRSLWRRLTRELESQRWFERADGETPQERAAMRGLARLPREQREVIVLKLWHDHTFEEIGALLELSPNTVAGRYRYGLQKLRTYLKTEDYEQTESSREPIAVLATALPLAEP